MRSKIILANGTIVFVLTVLCASLLAENLDRMAGDSVAQNARLGRTLRAADAQLAADALRRERFLSQRGALPSARGVFSAGTAAARQDAATLEANRIRDAAAADPDLGRLAPSLVLFVDAAGRGLGRDGSELMRGDRVGVAYPSLLGWLARGTTGSDVWVSQERQEQLLVSFAPLVDRDGVSLGGLVLGMPLNDERMAMTADLTSGGDLALVVDGLAIAQGGLRGLQFSDPAVLQLARKAHAGSLVLGRWEGRRTLLGALPLSGYAADNAVLVAALPASLLPDLRGALWPILAVGALGLFLVAVVGMLLGNYISRPIAELEDGLLRVINGEQDLRFELDHDELGGLSTRINTLLNSVQGIHEEESSSRSS